MPRLPQDEMWGLLRAGRTEVNQLRAAPVKTSIARENHKRMVIPAAREIPASSQRLLADFAGRISFGLNACDLTPVT